MLSLVRESLKTQVRGLDRPVAIRHTDHVKFAPGMIVKVSLPEGKHAFGRVTQATEDGCDGKATFVMSGRVAVSAIMEEMVTEAFYFEGKGRYGV